MEKLISGGRILYGSAMAAIGIHQLFYGAFTPMIVPAWPLESVAYTLLAYIGNIALALAGGAIAINKHARIVCLYLAGAFLVLFITNQIPFEIIFDPYKHHIVMWTNAFKEFAFAGGALVIAGTLPSAHNKNAFTNLIEKLVPHGHWFFATTMVLFGVMHISYIEHVSKLVPSWIAFPIFWTGLTGGALICSGICIVLRIKVRIVAILLAIMILLWFLMLHIPRAIDNPVGFGGNEIASALSALAFAGTAMVIVDSIIKTPD